ncbi:hypothetical protein [Vibrio phage VCPH]|nr:hypothetical protein [Vibrio phage VCPH]
MSLRTHKTTVSVLLNPPQGLKTHKGTVAILMRPPAGIKDHKATVSVLLKPAPRKGRRMSYTTVYNP